MLIQPPPAPPSRRRKKSPPGLTLVSASVSQAIALNLTMTFDRDISVAAIDPTQLVVNHPANSLIYRGNMVTTATGKTVTVSLTSFGPNTGPTAQLTASATTRIVAGNAGLWAGVTGLALPLA